MRTHLSLLCVLGCGACLSPPQERNWVPIDFVAQSLHTKDAITDIWASDPGNVYAIGRDGTIARSGGQRFDWVVEAELPSHRLVGIWGSGPSDVYVAAWGGAILHSTGDGAWTEVARAEQSLRGIWGSGPGDVYAVGDQGLILHQRDGVWRTEGSDVLVEIETLSARAPLAKFMLRSVWGAGPTEVYVAGDPGVILRSSGDGTWVQEALIVDNLQRIWGVGDRRFAVGRVAGLYGKVAGSWEQIATPPKTPALSAVWGATPDDLFLVGDAVLRLRSEASWDPVSSVAGTQSFQIWGTSADNIYVVGGSEQAGGFVLHNQ